MADGMQEAAAAARAHLESDADGTWVAIDVVQLAFGRSTRSAYDLAKQEGWRTAGRRPRQYAFADVKETYRRLKADRDNQKQQPTRKATR